MLVYNVNVKMKVCGKHDGHVELLLQTQSITLHRTIDIIYGPGRVIYYMKQKDWKLNV